MRSNPTLLLASFLVMLAACTPTPRTTNVAKVERGAFITLLGDDTLAVEQFQSTPAGVQVDAVVRTPQTATYHYFLTRSETGALERMNVAIEAPDGRTLREERYTRMGDSLQVTVTENGATQRRALAYQPDMLPFVDYLNWPFELMASRSQATGQDSLRQSLFTDRHTMDFVMRKEGNGRLSIVHPYRGTTTAEVNSEGQIRRFDAGATTRKLTVTRVPYLDVDAYTQQFSAQETGGNTFGPLSGRGKTESQIKGATITVDYGQPAKRGREIFGTVVPWDQVWRTGANQATHLETNRTLVLGDLTVPPGKHTLFTIPAPSGGMLIINKVTGQNGTSYHQEQDLGRVPMRIGKLPESIERSTIKVDETPAGGDLKLQWDRAQFTAPFTVK